MSEARCAPEKVLNLVNQPCWSHCLDGFLVTHGHVPKSTCFLPRPKRWIKQECDRNYLTLKISSGNNLYRFPMNVAFLLICCLGREGKFRVFHMDFLIIMAHIPWSGSHCGHSPSGQESLLQYCIEKLQNNSEVGPWIYWARCEMEEAKTSWIPWPQ